jgi:hypothetical protein
MRKTKVLLLFIMLFLLGLWILNHEVKSTINISKSNPKYFLVIYGDKWLKISDSRKDIFFNKIYSSCAESVVVTTNEKIKIIKPNSWKNISKKVNITNGLNIELYTDGKNEFNQKEIDSISLIEIRSYRK